MTVEVAENRGKVAESSTCCSISRRDLNTLHDLLEAIRRREPEQRGLVAMLGATAAHIQMHLGKSSDKIAIRDLLDVNAGLQVYFREKSFRRNSIRSYLNYIRILIQEAKKLGWAEDSPELAKAWQKILPIVAKEEGCPGIIRYAIRSGKQPAAFAEADLNGWGDAAIRDGRSYVYVQSLKSRFKRCVFRAGLGSDLPQLLPSRAGYGIPLSKFPLNLKAQVTELLRWKTAAFSLGRAARGKHRAVSATGLRYLISRIYGYLVKIKGREIEDIKDLFSRRSLSDYVEWAANERRTRGVSLATELGRIRALRAHPSLAGEDFGWIPGLISQLPQDVDTRLAKERRWVDYYDLVKIPDRIRRGGEKIPDLDKASKAASVRNALLIAWLTTLPWRQRNIRECKVLAFADGGNLFKEVIPAHSTMAKSPWVQERLRLNPDETFWQFHFRPEETKTGNRVRAILPRQLVGPLEEYLAYHRPFLLSGAEDPHTLFLNLHGHPWSSTRVQQIVEHLTFRYVGRRVNPHLFRDIFAVQWLDEHPEDYLTLSKILWHSNIQTTLRIYGRNFDESHGARRVEEWLDARKKGRTAA